jgi:ATP-dependent RNA helicase DOB1
VNVHRNVKVNPESIVGGVVDVSGVSYTLDVLLSVALSDTPLSAISFRPFNAATDDKSAMGSQVLQVSLSLLYKISAVRLNLPKQLCSNTDKSNVQKAMLELQRRFKGSDNVPVLDPIQDIGIKTADFLSMSSRHDDLLSRFGKCEFSRASNKDAAYELYCKKLALLEESRHYRKLVRESQAVLMKEELRRMKRVLRRLGFVSTEDVLEIKGKFSCELNTADELLLTEMFFEGVFNSLTSSQIVSLLSCFVHQEVSKDTTSTPRADLRDAYRQLLTVARSIVKAKVDAKIPCDEEEYVKTFNCSLMDATYSWSTGAKFIDICKMTEVFEGSLIRSIRRLEELLRQLSSAALSIGNTELRDKFEQGANSIRRGVVFAASLYL